MAKAETDKLDPECTHGQWEYASTLTVNTQQPMILVLLYCPKCGEVQVKVVRPFPKQTKANQQDQPVIQQAG